MLLYSTLLYNTIHCGDCVKDQSQSVPDIERPQSVISCFRSSMGETAFAKLQPSCQWFITLSPGRSEMDSGRNIWGTSENSRSLTSGPQWLKTDYFVQQYEPVCCRDVKSSSRPRPRGPKTGLRLGLMTVVASASFSLASWPRSF